MHLLVTRPKPDASDLITRLETAGHQTSHFPLIDIVFRDDVTIPAKPYQAVLVTSANGARAFNNRALPCDKAITVGPASTIAARKAGFTNIEQAKGDVEAMIRHVKASLDPQDGPLLYASGAKTTGNLQNRLQASSFKIDRSILYDALAATNIPQELNLSSLDGILLFSPRTAKIWFSLQETPYKYNQHKFFCLSQNVAMIASQFNINSKNILIAASPENNSIVELINSTTQ